MFREGNTVLYGTTGVCTVEGLIEKEIAHQKKQYYVLRPVSQPQSAVYVPIDNAVLLGKAKPLLSQSEWEHLVKSLPEETPVWMEEGARRREAFAATQNGGDRIEQMQTMRMLYSQKQSFAENGKHLSVADDRVLRELARLLCEEITAVFGFTFEQAFYYIITRGN